MTVSNSEEKLLFIRFSPCGANADIDKFPCAERVFSPSLVFNLEHIPSEVPHLCLLLSLPLSSFSVITKSYEKRYEKINIKEACSVGITQRTN